MIQKYGITTNEIVIWLLSFVNVKLIEITKSLF